MSTVLLQLPLHPGTAWEPTGNIPLAPAKLAAQAGLHQGSVFPEKLLDSMGDQSLLEELLKRRPRVIGVTLYLWNRARTLNLVKRYKEHHPETLAVAGGPEVTPDNLSLLHNTAIDLFVAGEGEFFAKTVLHHESLVEVIRTGQRLLGPVTDTSAPDRWPDPYETGHIKPFPGGSAHIETQRGCGCLCSYCAYRRNSPVPRILPADKAIEKIRLLSDLGAGELVFLDPTFNARGDLEALLRGMKRIDLECFAEVRADLIRSPHAADALRHAGFNSLEAGLQTMNAEVLRDVGRGGSPMSILDGAELIRNAGITPLIDLILGLPGDHPESIEKAALEITRRSLGEQVQTFLLSVLPGTELRVNAEKLSVTYRDTPPYCISSSGVHALESLLDSRETVSDILGYDADPPPRPVLSGEFPGMEVFIPEEPNLRKPPSVRHGVLRIVTGDAWENRQRIMERLLLRRSMDPFCPLDVVIDSRVLFPLDLLEMINDLPEPECYDTEKAHIYGLPSLVRTAVVAEPGTDINWLMECSRMAVTVIRTNEPSALPGGDTGLLIRGVHDLSELSALYSQAPHLVFFDDPGLERLWNLEVLGLG